MSPADIGRSAVTSQRACPGGLFRWGICALSTEVAKRKSAKNRLGSRVLLCCDRQHRVATAFVGFSEGLQQFPFVVVGWLLAVIETQ